MYSTVFDLSIEYIAINLTFFIYIFFCLHFFALASATGMPIICHLPHMPCLHVSCIQITLYFIYFDCQQNKIVCD